MSISDKEIESSGDYDEVLAPIKSLTTDQNNQFKAEGFIKVHSPNTINAGLKDHTTYTIESSYLPAGTTSITKRYRDFNILRQNLVEHWPGIFIPNIPKKQVLGRLEEGFIQLRCRLLENFCQKLIQNSHLIKSQELNLFFSSKDFESKSESFVEILEKYLKAFKLPMNELNVQTTNTSLNDVSVMLNKSLGIIKVRDSYIK